MNTIVNATGMEVKAQVSDNILIAASTSAATAKADDTAFKTSYVMPHSVTLLEPVSTIDGSSFFYTSGKNVTANGDAASDVYVAYNPSSTDDFNDNYGTTGAVGYVDYAFQLKADNTGTAGKSVVMNKLDLTYGGTTAADKAWRVAVFVDDMGETGATAAASTQTSTNLKSILRVSGAAYFTADSAVSTASTIDEVNAKIDDKVVIGTVSAGKTNYYKVVVRLWLEGEDTTCTNTTFATLTDIWALDLSVKLADSDTDAVVNLNQSATSEKFELYGATVDTTAANAKIIDNVTYKPISGKTGYYVTVDTIAEDTIVYQIGTDLLPYDVTNQFKYTVPTP